MIEAPPHPTLQRLLGSAVLAGFALALISDVLLLVTGLVAGAGNPLLVANPLALLIYVLIVLIGAACGLFAWLICLLGLLVTVRLLRVRPVALAVAAFVGYCGGVIGLFVLTFGGIELPAVEIPVAAVWGVGGAVAMLGAWYRKSTLGYLRPRP